MTPLAFLAGAGAVAAVGGLLLAGTAYRVGPVDPPVRRTRPRKRPQGRQWVAAAVAGTAALVATGWVAAGVAAAGAVLVVPAVLGLSTDAKQRIARLEALAAWTRRLADLLASRAVGSLDEALRRSAATAPTAIEAEVRALVDRMGPQGLEPALRAFAGELGDPAGDHVAMALILRSRSGGGGLAKVLVGLSQDVDEQVRMRRDIQAERDKPMNSLKSLVVLTVAAWVGLTVFARDYMAPYSTPGGQVALGVAVAIFAAGGLWLLRLSRPVVGARLLLDDGDDGRGAGQ